MEETNNMKKQILFVLLVLTASASMLFANGGKEQVTIYTFGGSSTVAPIITSAIPGFEAENKGSSVTYETLGSSVGIKALQEGTVSLAGSSRELKKAELEAGLIPTTIALDGLSVAVNRSVPIANLSMDELSAIFAGEITNWKEVGGQDAEIVLIVRDETSGTYGSFKEIVLDSRKKSVSSNAIVARENGELATKIASTPNSIGYVGMAFNHIISEAGGKILSIDGVTPAVATVKDKTYPISRSLYVVSKGELSGFEKTFVDYILSRKGQAIVEETGFIGIR